MSGQDLLLNQQTLVRLLLVACLTGIALGILYDALCLLRLLLCDPNLIGQPHPRRSDTHAGKGAAPIPNTSSDTEIDAENHTDNMPETGQKTYFPQAVFRFLADFVFALVASLTLILLNYYQSDGQLRAPAIFGMAGGFFLYRKTVSRLVLRVCRTLCALLWSGIRIILGGIAFVLKIPLTALFRLFSRLFVRLWQCTGDRLVRRHRARRMTRRFAALITEASGGFHIRPDLPRLADLSPKDPPHPHKSPTPGES